TRSDALLTRSPLNGELPLHPVRLACVKHAASVQSEPGSNSSVRSQLQSSNSLDSAIHPLDESGQRTVGLRRIRMHPPPTALASCEHSSLGTPTPPESPRSRAARREAGGPSPQDPHLSIADC